jgi:peptide chain release factor 2
VYPLVEDDIEIDIDESDLRIDTYRASGAGGQHVNKTDSAVRITHEPSGIVVACQQERSQHKNRSTAMKMLRAALYQRELQEREAAKQELEQGKSAIDFGSQIRSYVFQPYTMVNDHRTEVKITDVHGVMDGDLDPLIEAYLKQTGAAASN